MSLSATVSPDNATEKGVNWTVDKISIADVNSSGEVTAKAVGTAIVTATAKDGGSSNTATITVTAPADVKAESVTLNKTTLALTVGGTETLSATVAPAGTTNKNVKWKSSNESVATVNESSGLVTAKAAGSATITATTDDGSNKSANCTLTVSNAVVNVPVGGASISQSAPTIKVGQTTTINVTVTPSTASNKNVTWSSDNTSVATVDATSGVVTGKAVGRATITAKTVDGGKTASITVTVVANNSPITNLRASSINDTRVTLTYSAPSGASSVRVYRSTTNSSSGFSDIGSISTSASSYELTGLSTGTRYWVKLKVTGGSNEGDSNVVDFTTSGSSGIYDKSPASGAKSVSCSSNIEFRFNDAMRSSTINTDNIYLKRNGSGSNISATVEYSSSSRRVTINPKEDLDSNTKYTVYVTSSVRYDNGDSFKSESWDFTTAEGGFKITEKNPTEDEKDVALDKQIRIRFSRDLKSSTVNEDNIYLRGDDGNVRATVSYSSKEVTIKPKNPLIAGVKYTVTVTSDVKDTDNNSISKTTWDFTTYKAKTTITERNPAAGQSVAGLSTVTFKFSNDMDKNSINSSSVFIKKKSTNMMIPCLVSYSTSNRQVMVMPSTPFEKGQEYTVVVSSSVRDDSRNSFSGEEWSFRIEGTAVVTPWPPVNPGGNVAPGQIKKGTAFAPVVKMNGQYVNFADARPYVKNKRTMLPMRTLFEMLGAQMQWDNASQKVTASLNGNTIELFIGKKIAYRNGVKINLDAAPELSKGRTMVPLRFASESLGYQVGWDAKNYTVTFGQ